MTEADARTLRAGDRVRWAFDGDGPAVGTVEWVTGSSVTVRWDGLGFSVSYAWTWGSALRVAA